MTNKSFSETIGKLQNFVIKTTNQPEPLISEEVYNVVMENQQVLDGAIIHDRDIDFDYFGFKTLQKSYLLKIDGKIVERPQHFCSCVWLLGFI